jgi:hypothetical protein
MPRRYGDRHLGGMWSGNRVRATNMLTAASGPVLHVGRQPLGIPMHPRFGVEQVRGRASDSDRVIDAAPSARL